MKETHRKQNFFSKNAKNAKSAKNVKSERNAK